MEASGDRVIGRSGDRRRVNAALMIFCFVVVFSTASAWAQAPEGIPRDLARDRVARIFDVRYDLSYKLEPKAPATSGEEEIKFRLRPAALPAANAPVLLDFRGGTLGKVTVNGKEIAAKIDNGHIELPADLLKLSAKAASEGVETAREGAVATDNLGRPVGPKPGARIFDSRDDNVVDIEFTAPIATAGKAFTRFEDKDDGNEYVYTLFVPMDANMAFPCFDQPDIKGQFYLRVLAPEEWVVISNSDMENLYSSEPGKRLSIFEPTKPISTYLFAFAAGPFARVHPRGDLPGLYVRRSKESKAEAEGEEVQQITKKGMDYLAEYFDQPFPFSKYDMVMIPGFAYGGMEHAGATFLREESILFRTAPTHSDRLNRDILLLHELTHQWFGDLVTMRWFDDLWLKEGFANYMAYHALADMKPKENVWKRFYQAMKPAAYGIDATQGTTPIYQDIANLKDAKSAYGAIVYSKAPGVMRQLNFVIGEDKFRDGLRAYLRDHAYANAEWSDLVKAFEKSSGKPLDKWADAYIRHRGMPQVDVAWACNPQGTISSMSLTQHDVLGSNQTWPIVTEVLLSRGKAAPVRLRAQLDTPKAAVKKAIGKACPVFVFANDQDYAYGRFLLDAKSRKAVVAQLGGMNDVFQRTLLWGSLWESVREAQMDPREYINLALRLLPAEKDEQLAQSVIVRSITALHRYVPAETRAELAPKMETLASNEMLHSQDQDMRIIWFRALRAVAETPKARGELKDVLAGKLVIPGVELRQLDRWNMVESLVALNDADAESLLQAEEKKDSSGDGRKYAFMAQAARPNAGNKKHYFDDYLHDQSRPEDWVEESLGAFNYWNQSDLTLPYLRPALDALPQVKSERKIFFVLGWLNSFIGGQKSAEAQAQVDDFLKTATVDKDLRLKILEVKDELDRTVKIRAKYGAAAEKKAVATK